MANSEGASATVANVGRQHSSVASHHWLRSRENDSFVSGADEEIVDRMPPEIPAGDGSDARRPRFYQIDSEVLLGTHTSGDERQSQSSVSAIESETVQRQQQANQLGKSPLPAIETASESAMPVISTDFRPIRHQSNTVMERSERPTDVSFAQSFSSSYGIDGY